MQDIDEQQTVPETIDLDLDTYITPDHQEADGSRHCCGAPIAVPDHGRMSRRPPRPTAVAYSRDRDNLYRPAGDPFAASMYANQAPVEDRKQREVARLLVKVAKDHAPRLALRRDDVIDELIEREILPAARFIANTLPDKAKASVLAKFLEVLREEIEFIRKTSRSRKRDHFF